MPDGGPLDIEDPGGLIAYLRGTGRIGGSETPRVHVLAGGVSNKTVLVERETGEAWVLKQALSKLRVKADWFSDPSRIRREADALRWLPKFSPPGTITPLVFEDRERHVLAMQAVPQPHDNWKAMLLAGRVDLGLVEQFAAILGTIHRKSAEAAAEVRPVFEDRSFFESLRIEPYYAYAAARVPGAAEFLHDLVRDTRQRRLTLVHGDYSPKNVLVRGGRLVLLDHEVVHWGDPAFDVGFALTHFISKARHLPAFRGAFAKAATTFIVDYDAARRWPDGNPGQERMAVRHALACMLARAAGRSPLEYLGDGERQRQADAAVRLMRATPPTIPDVVSEFVFGNDDQHGTD